MKAGILNIQENEKGGLVQVKLNYNLMRVKKLSFFLYPKVRLIY